MYDTTFFRCNKYLDMVCKGEICAEKLPPTNRAAYCHGLRVFYQIRHRSSLKEHSNYLDWGWTKIGNGLVPITTDLNIAPLELKRVIRCHCNDINKNARGTNRCVCRKKEF